MSYRIPKLPLSIDVETKAVLRQLNLANRKLAELKGVALTIPNENILINTLILQEAKDSSAVENIVTTHDELFQADLNVRNLAISSATKEVLSYAEALKKGFNLVRKNKILNNNHIKTIQEVLERNKAGFRSVPGTTLQNEKKEIVYTPPQGKSEVLDYMANLELYINDDDISSLDPLIKMAIIHHQFESIHPFYDGNGRTGRIINILYLVIKGLLDIPILYLSRYIITNKTAYYKLLQKVRDEGDWESWILFVLKGIEETASQTIELVKGIGKLMQEYKVKIKEVLGKSYSHELINNLFSHPYTKIQYVMEEVEVVRVTATNYLNQLVDAGLLEKMKVGRTNYYLNMPLIKLFIESSSSSIDASKTAPKIESINE